MTKTASSDLPDAIDTTVEALPRLSDVRRRTLRTSLDAARAEIVAGNFDVVTSKTLRQEFDGIFYDDMTDDELDARVAERSARQP